MYARFVKREVRARLGRFEYALLTIGAVCAALTWTTACGVGGALWAFVERGALALVGPELANAALGDAPRAVFSVLVGAQMWLVSMRLRHAGLPGWAALGLLVPRANLFLLLWSAVAGLKVDRGLLEGQRGLRLAVSTIVLGTGSWCLFAWPALSEEGREIAVVVAPFAVAFAASFVATLFDCLRLGQCCTISFGAGVAVLVVSAFCGLPPARMLYCISPVSMAMVLAGAFLAFELQPHMETRGKNLPMV